jgi:hypothetical protein
MAVPKLPHPSGPSNADAAATATVTGPYTSTRKPQLKKGNEPSNQLDANRGDGGPSTASSTGTRGTNDSPAVDHTMDAGMGGVEVYPVPHPMAYGVPFGYTMPNPYRHHGGNDIGNGGNGGNGGGTQHQHTAPCLTPEVLSLHNRAWDHRYTQDIDRWAANAGIGRRLLVLPEASVAAASVGHASTARGDDGELDQWYVTFPSFRSGCVCVCEYETWD